MWIKTLLLISVLSASLSFESETKDTFELHEVGSQDNPTEITYNLDSIFDNKTIYLGIKSGTGYNWVVDEKSLAIEVYPFGSKYIEPVYGGKGKNRQFIICREGWLCKEEYVTLVYLKTWLITKYKDGEYEQYDSLRPKVLKVNINFPHEKYFEEDFQQHIAPKIQDQTKNVNLQKNEKFMIELDRVSGSSFTWLIFNKTSNLDITYLGTEKRSKGEGGREVISWDVIPSDRENETETVGEIMLIYIKEELLEIYRSNQDPHFSRYLQNWPVVPKKYKLNVQIIGEEQETDLEIDEEGEDDDQQPIKVKSVKEVIIPEGEVENLDEGDIKTEVQDDEYKEQMKKEKDTKEQERQDL